MSVTVNVNATNLSKADLGTCYSCNSQDVIREGGVSQTLWSVLIQAFVANGSKSQESKYTGHDASTRRPHRVRPVHVADVPVLPPLSYVMRR